MLWNFRLVLSFFNFLLLIPFIYKVDFHIPGNLYILLFASSCLQTIAFLFMMKAAKHWEISLISPLLNLSVVVTAVLAFFIIGERLTFTKMSGIFFNFDRGCLTSKRSEF